MVFRGAGPTGCHQWQTVLCACFLSAVQTPPLSDSRTYPSHWKQALCPVRHSSQVLPNLNPHHQPAKVSVGFTRVAISTCHLSLADVVRIQPGCGVYRCSTPWCMVFCGLNLPHGVCQSTDPGLFLFRPLWVGLQWTSVYQFLYEHPFQSYQLDTRNVVIGSNSNSTIDLLGTIKLFYTLSVSFHVHTDDAQACQFPHGLANSGFSLYLS